jgi:hypothetical protein
MARQGFGRSACGGAVSGCCHSFQDPSIWGAKKSKVSLVILEAKQHGVGSGLGGLENEGKSKMPRHKGVGSGEVHT